MKVSFIQKVRHFRNILAAELSKESNAPLGEVGWCVGVTARITKLIKAIIKNILFTVVWCIPSTLILKIRDKFARIPRQQNLIYSYVERIVNNLNRRLLLERLVKSGICYFPSNRPEDRYQIYDYVFDTYVHEPVDYLEFGVAGGQSIRWVLSKLGPNSNLFGFDSFEGLPENWYFNLPKGAFSQGGAIPEFIAPNLKFIEGWFEESLKPFLESTELKPHLVLHMDADIYSATIYVMRAMKDLFIPGTIVIFDQYWFVKDEFRALQDFVSETGKRFEYLSITNARAAVRFLT